ncbi:MAG: Ig-like domain repeat protein [Solirubrobacterales bacterium]|nr:Ig-like domain repeat protein [Solirubrobacterales bacterium]
MRRRALLRFATATAVALALLVLGGGAARAAGVGLTVTLSPASIPADGVAQTTATVTLSPPLAGQQIELYAPFDSQLSFGAVHDNGDGTYTAILTSSRRAEVTQIFAADGAGTGEVIPATLTQVGASATSVVAVTNQPVTSANPPVTNQGVVLLATVTSLAENVVSPSGTISFQNDRGPIAGCQSLPVSPELSGSVSVTCDASFAGGSSPAAVTAEFTPADGSLVGASTSAADDFPVAPDSTSTAVSTASPPGLGAPVRYVARVTPDHAGAVAPTGFVRFADRGAAVPGCAHQPLAASSTATCTVTYRASGTHAISASYSGDASFQSSDSGTLAESLQPVGTIGASMQWRFYYTRGFTRLLQLILSRAPVGSHVSITCRGDGCRFTHRALTVRGRTLNLTRQIAQSRLRPRARVTVAITKPGWAGKAYVFTARAGRPPAVQIGCIEPGGHRIAASC